MSQFPGKLVNLEGSYFQNRGKWHYEKETNNIITIAYKRTVYCFYVIKDRKYQLATDIKHGSSRLPRVAGGTGRGSGQAAGLDWSLNWLCPWAADSTMCARAAGTALSKMTRGKWAHTTTFVPRLAQNMRGSCSNWF